jgi:hypothetical protein
VKSLITMLLVLIASIAYANPQDEGNEIPPSEQQVPQVYYLPSIIDCGAPEDIYNIIQRFGEIPFIEGDTMVKRPDGVVMPAKMTMYFNASTGTYSLVAKFPAQFWCILSSGGKIQAVIPKEST